MDIFEKCLTINNLIHNNDEENARDELLKTLQSCKDQNIAYSPMLNNLIRQLGLYPYLQIDQSSWQERFVYEAFKVDIGDDKPITLHREQSSVLKLLLNDKDLAVIAPTSFGKSFIIDAFISIKKPSNVVIIVPTIALMDESRRRLNRKFASEYKLITTPNEELTDKNIFIFPQERALQYVDKIDTLDILVVDEFYKASSEHDKERSKPLLNVILKLKDKAKLKYYLAPNISSIKENPLTKGMEIKIIKFNTVFLEIHELYENTIDKKMEKLLSILKNTTDKTLIYAGTFPEIRKIERIINDNLLELDNEILNSFSNWLAKNYSNDWYLTKLVKLGTGVHNGRLHRSISQIQVKLFEENKDLKNIISTSSIIEGVNTSAKNVVMWRNKTGGANLKYFDYRNLIGRSGRMFKHFIGNVYLLEKPPQVKPVQLEFEMPNELIDQESIDSSSSQFIEIKRFHINMQDILGNEIYTELKNQGFFKKYSWSSIETITKDIQENSNKWHTLKNLNSNNCSYWENFLYIILKLFKYRIKHREFVKFVQILSENWYRPIPELIKRCNLGIEDFFELEKKVVFDFANTLDCINILQQKLLPYSNADISPFIAKVSHAFLPRNVYLLEEYGLPRMISKKINSSKLINLEEDETISNIISKFNGISYNDLIQNIDNLDEFDKYFLKYFYDGIKTK